MDVKGNHPLAEIIARKMMGINGVPPEEREAMVHRAAIAAVRWYEEDAATQRLAQLYPEQCAPVEKSEKGGICKSACKYQT